MAVQGGAEEDVYATLLLSDTYLPGALVLAHSLRDAGTSKKLAVLVTTDTVSAEVINELKTVYDHVIPVERLHNDQPANLHLMNRADLHSAFTKINLWKQIQFRKIVYIDSDVVAYRAPDELFDLPHPFSAAPDIGWPDLFNTGVMALTPNMGDYYAMVAMAEKNISFDGADQGLINMYFKDNYNRISFAYNVTPSGHYQYVPAYRHFASGIAMVHFIGSEKPWFQGRRASTGSSPYDEMTGRWWAVYDKHYRVPSPTGTPGQSVPGGSAATSSAGAQYVPALVQYFTKGEFQPNATYAQTPSGLSGAYHGGQQQHFHSHGHGYGHYHHTPMSSWDAQRHSPPKYSKPEAMNFPATIYEMSRDSTPYQAPKRYPGPPRSIGYEVSRKSQGSPKHIFPWEDRRSPPRRVFPDSQPRQKEPVVSSPATTTGGSWYAAASQTSAAPSIAETSTAYQMSEPDTPTTPTIYNMPSNPWSSFNMSNAWDEVPGIERYVERMQQHQRRQSLKSGAELPEDGEEAEITLRWRRRGSRVTDFPSESERPSLPVTPAPIHRSNFWGGGPGIGDDNSLLPAAVGVPGQTEWVCAHGRQWTPTDCLCDLTNVLRYYKDPVVQLQKLAKQQSEALLHKLESGGRDSSDFPSRPLPFGSEELVSPTYVARSAHVFSPQPLKGNANSGALHSIESNLDETSSIISSQSTAVGSIRTFAEPSYAGPGAAFEKGELTEDLSARRATAPRLSVVTKATTIPEPSYAGPGPAFDKDAVVSVGEGVD
ncbi:glycosyltransferase family 8 protein [Jackrogersella minutella]|nr:glycosyltransferase family 8 protein [Jackrogersella minutella]